jgi:hypothetical protein
MLVLLLNKYGGNENWSRWLNFSWNSAASNLDKMYGTLYGCAWKSLFMVLRTEGFVIRKFGNVRIT